MGRCRAEAFDGEETVSDNDNVIHVSFGPGGGKRHHKPPPPPPPEEHVPQRARDPLTGLYSLDEASRLFDISASRLRYWDRSGFIRRSRRVGGRRYYTFQDLIGLRAAKGLLDRGVPVRSVRRSLESLRRTLPRVARPLSALRVVAEGHRLVVRDHDTAFEPQTGQLVLDFEVQSLRDDVVRVLHAQPRSAEQRRAAYEHYLEGCQLDEDDITLDRAERAYQRALQLDPTLANAHTNLGNLFYRRGQVEEAKREYGEALRIDPGQPEAFYNLGFLLYDQGDSEGAVESFRQALAHDPAFADAHFNLAMALEEQGCIQDARTHWQAYVELDPDSPWAEIARRHLGRRSV